MPSSFLKCKGCGLEHHAAGAKACEDCGGAVLYFCPVCGTYTATQACETCAARQREELRRREEEARLQRQQAKLQHEMDSARCAGELEKAVSIGNQLHSIGGQPTNLPKLIAAHELLTQCQSVLPHIDAEEPAARTSAVDLLARARRAFEAGAIPFGALQALAEPFAQFELARARRSAGLEAAGAAVAIVPVLWCALYIGTWSIWGVGKFFGTSDSAFWWTRSVLFGVASLAYTIAMARPSFDLPAGVAALIAGALCFLAWTFGVFLLHGFWLGMLVCVLTITPGTAFLIAGQKQSP